jgi:hypothetical protein
MAKKSKKARATDYPPYAVAFKVGDTTLKKERGTHSFNLPPLAPGVSVRVSITQRTPEPGVPNLLFTITRNTDKSTNSKKKE